MNVELNWKQVIST